MATHFLRKQRGQRSPFSGVSSKRDHRDRPLKNVGSDLFEDSHGNTYRRAQDGSMRRSVR